MEVTMNLDNWKIKKDEKNNTKVAGTYKIMLGDKEVANQGFNNGYGSTEITFSSDVMRKAKDLGRQITTEIENYLK